MAKISEVGRSKTQDTPPDYGTNTEHDPLLEGQPVEYISTGKRIAFCLKTIVTISTRIRIAFCLKIIVTGKRIAFCLKTIVTISTHIRTCIAFCLRIIVTIATHSLLIEGNSYYIATESSVLKTIITIVRTVLRFKTIATISTYGLLFEDNRCHQHYRLLC